MLCFGEWRCVWCSLGQCSSYSKYLITLIESSWFSAQSALAHLLISYFVSCFKFLRRLCGVCLLQVWYSDNGANQFLNKSSHPAPSLPMRSWFSAQNAYVHFLISCLVLCRKSCVWWRAVSLCAIHSFSHPIPPTPHPQLLSLCEKYFRALPYLLYPVLHICLKFWRRLCGVVQ